MTTKPTSIDIAREMYVHIQAGISCPKALLAAVRRKFPGVTTREMQRACHVGADMVEMHAEVRNEHVRAVIDEAWDAITNNKPASAALRPSEDFYPSAHRPCD